MWHLAINFRVSDTYHHGAHLADGRVTQHFDEVLTVVLDIKSVDFYLGVTVGDSGVTVRFSVNHLLEFDLKVVIFRPDAVFIGYRSAPWCHLQRYLIFIVVVGEVGAETYECRDFVVEHRVGVGEALGVHEHFQFLIEAEVEFGCLINASGVAVDEVLDCELQCLLILTHC